MKPILILVVFLISLAAGCAAQTKKSEPVATTPPPSSTVETAAAQDNLNRPAPQTASGQTETEKLLEKGEIARAVKLLNDKYSGKPADDDEAKRLQTLLLKAAHREALKTKDYKKAAQVMETAFQAAPLGITMVLLLNPERQDIKFVPAENDYRQYGFDKFMAWNEYVEIVNDYGFFLEQSGESRQAVEVLAQVIKMSPQREAAHLNLADALWKRGDHQEATTEYKKYTDLMTANGKASGIPDRIKKRLP